MEVLLFASLLAAAAILVAWLLDGRRVTTPEDDYKAARWQELHYGGPKAKRQ